MPIKTTDNCFIFTISIPSDAKTNISRYNLSIKEFAIHRTNKFIITKIEDLSGNTYETIKSDIGNFTVGEQYTNFRYEENAEIVYANDNYYFFLNKNAAYLYDDRFLPGHIEKWFDNGKKWFEGSINEHGNKDGLWEEWYRHGQIRSLGNYIDGKKVGVWKTWHQTGRMKSEGCYKDGVEHGLWKTWDSNGFVESVCLIKNGSAFTLQ